MNMPTPTTFAVALGPADVDPDLCTIPLAAAHVRLGFPSPADDFQEDPINLHQLLVRRPAATFLYRADGWSMSGAGINDGDILVVDKSVRPLSGDLVIACWDGNQPTCKVLQEFPDHIELYSANPDHPPIILPPGTEVEVFAVVGIARQIHRRPLHVRSR